MSLKAANPRLGRGLAALLGEQAAASEPGTRAQHLGVQSVPIEQLEPGPFQPRGVIDPGALTDLARSIRQSGVLQPLLARPHPTVEGRLQIIAGERRWRAAQEAGLHEVPILLRELSHAEAMAAGLIENLQRQDLNAIEEAEGYKRLFDEFEMTQEALAESVGKSRSHIANTVRLLNLPVTVRNEVRKGALSAGHARALLSHPEPEKAAMAVISRGLNVRQTEAMSSAKVSAGQSDAPRALQRDPETLALEQDLTNRLGLKVSIVFDGKGGSIKLNYRSLDQLDGIVTLLSRT